MIQEIIVRLFSVSPGFGNYTENSGKKGRLAGGFALNLANKLYKNKIFRCCCSRWESLVHSDIACLAATLRYNWKNHFSIVPLQGEIQEVN